MQFRTCWLFVVALLVGVVGSRSAGAVLSTVVPGPSSVPSQDAAFGVRSQDDDGLLIFTYCRPFNVEVRGSPRGSGRVDLPGIAHRVRLRLLDAGLAVTEQGHETLWLDIAVVEDIHLATIGFSRHILIPISPGVMHGTNAWMWRAEIVERLSSDAALVAVVTDAVDDLVDSFVEEFAAANDGYCDGSSSPPASVPGVPTRPGE